LEGMEIYGSEGTVEGPQRVVISLDEQKTVALLNVVGLAALVAFTGLVYLRTQEALILIVGGLISVVGVLGMMMGRS